MLKLPQANPTKPWLLGVYLTLTLTVAVAISFLPTHHVHADDAKIVDVAIVSAGNNIYNISVTLAHADTGWDHYANRWDVLDPQGNLLGSRVLAHPHVNEQPFTRSLRVEIPATVKMITIVAADSVHGDNEETLTVEVPKPE